MVRVALPLVESLEASIRNLRRCRAADALGSLQRESERRGLDRLTLDEINEEIQAAREDRAAR